MGRVDGDHASGAMIIGGDFQALGIVRNLAELDIPIYVLYSGFCITRFSRLIKEFIKCPPLSDNETFADFLVQLAQRKRLERTVIFPNNDATVCLLAKHRAKLERHYLIPIPEWETTRFAYDKVLTYRLAEEVGVPFPNTFFPGNEADLNRMGLEFPVILKPAVMAHFYPVTGLKAICVKNNEELIRGYRYMSSVVGKSEIMVQEIIGGGPKNLYSFCSLFVEGTVKGKIMAVRLRQHPMDFGSSSTYVVTCHVPELEELATRMLRKINYYGLSEVEFMFDERDGTFKLLEINARTWGWHSLGAKAGVNFSSLLFRDLHNDPVCLDSYELGVKWIRELADLPVAVSEIFKRRLTVGDYLRSLRGKKEWAVFSPGDPLPFIAELFWMPYMWAKRGFRM